jgi:hypothetical protein
MYDQKLTIALNWLILGFDLIPIQPNTKYIMRGFGLHQRRIKTPDEAKKYFGSNSKNNLAVICNGDNFIIDFDDWNIYTQWAKSAAECYTTSYTEYSPKGAHVFLCGDLVDGLQLIDGVEIKKIALAFPSVVDGKKYTQGTFPRIYRGDVDDCFFSLSKAGTPTAYLLRTREKNPIIESTQKKNFNPARSSGADVIARIKIEINALDVLKQYAKTSYDTMQGDGRFRAFICPFHKGQGKNGKERNRSFWVDTERNLYGCHTCHKSGDVINLFADLRAVEVRNAIKTLAEQLRGGNHVEA